MVAEEKDEVEQPLLQVTLIAVQLVAFRLAQGRGWRNGAASFLEHRREWTADLRADECEVAYQLVHLVDSGHITAAEHHFQHGSLSLPGSIVQLRRVDRGLARVAAYRFQPNTRAPTQVSVELK